MLFWIFFTCSNCTMWPRIFFSRSLCFSYMNWRLIFEYLCLFSANVWLVLQRRAIDVAVFVEKTTFYSYPLRVGYRNWNLFCLHHYKMENGVWRLCLVDAKNKSNICALGTLKRLFLLLTRDEEADTLISSGQWFFYKNYILRTG